MNRAHSWEAPAACAASRPTAARREPIAKLMQVLFDEGVMTFYAGHGPYHLRMLPPVGVMEPKHWEPVFQIIERAMAKV